MPEHQESSEPRDRYAAAEQRARAKLEFLRHAVTYVVVISTLAAINLLTNPDYLWFLWPAGGWGIGLFAHASNVFVFSDAMLKRLTDRELRRQL